MEQQPANYETFLMKSVIGDIRHIFRLVGFHGPRYQLYMKINV